MAIYTSILFFIICTIPHSSHAVQTSQSLPMRIDPISKQEIRQRLGLKETDPSNNGSGMLSIGSGPNMKYTLMNEHEVLCPISGAHQGILCTVILPLSQSIIGSENADSIASNHELVAQAILSGSLAESIRNRCKDGNSVYYLPIAITLVESLMADELGPMDLRKMVFNCGGLETNKILMDISNDDGPLGEEGKSVMMYACNTQSDLCSATSDVYVLPQEEKGKIWKFSVYFRVATINLQQISSFGDNDSTTPLRPDVWLKDDSY